MLIAEELVKSGNITAITHNLPVAFVLSENLDVTLVVTDSSKFGRRGFNLVLPMEKIDTIITDSGIHEAGSQTMAQTAANVMIV